MYRKRIVLLYFSGGVDVFCLADEGEFWLASFCCELYIYMHLYMNTFVWGFYDRGFQLNKPGSYVCTAYYGFVFTVVCGPRQISMHFHA